MKSSVPVAFSSSNFTGNVGVLPFDFFHINITTPCKDMLLHY